MTLTSDYAYELPEDRIAQIPIEPRDASKLMVLNASTGDILHDKFANLGEYIDAGDLLVRNNTRVTAKRLRGAKESGGAVEALLLQDLGAGRFKAAMRPGRRLQPGARVHFGKLVATVTEVTDDGLRELCFESAESLRDELESIGELPLPPYIKRSLPNDDRYQTVYSKVDGSSAAPTAGLHFTTRLEADLKAKGVLFAEVTLNVGLDTFRPIQSKAIDKHEMHGEQCHVPLETAEAVRTAPGRIVAVGTTSARTLESCASGRRTVTPGTRCTSLFIQPGYRHQVCDALLTNFHMPRTTMLLMAASFCSRETLMHAYQVAINENYRFLSFGDSMLILGGHNEETSL